jgi:hypothetical protein
MILGGLYLATRYFLHFDISAPMEGGAFGVGRVANISLVAERQAGISYGTLLVVLGIASMYAGREKDLPARPAPAPAPESAAKE